MKESVQHTRALAIEWATAVGIDQAAKDEFANAVARFCDAFPHLQTGISFGIHFNAAGHHYLRAMGDGQGSIAEAKIPVKVDKHGIPLLSTADGIDELLLKNRNLEQSNQDLKQFTFSIAHDLKNSLTKLKLAVSLLEKETLSPIAQRHLNIIDNSARQLEEMTLRLNELIELGHTGPGVIKEVQLDALFRRVHDEYQESLSLLNASVNTDFNYTNRIPYVEIYLKSIFSNLISNSVKYASPERALEINISARTQNDKVIIDFSDNGQGIDLQAHTREQLFQPFTRFSENTDGRGLGLYIVKSIVERNGGSVDVDSKLNGGTTFHFTLQPYRNTQN